MERRATSVFLRIEGDTGKNLRRQEQKTSSYDPLKPRTRGHRSGFLGLTLGYVKVCQHFPLGGSDPRVVMINSMNIIDIMSSCFLTSNYGVVHANKFDKVSMQ
jgi:hypothetical protein